MSTLPHLQRFEYEKRIREECDEEDIEYKEPKSDGEIELEENREEDAEEEEEEEEQEQEQEIESKVEEDKHLTL